MGRATRSASAVLVAVLVVAACAGGEGVLDSEAPVGTVPPNVAEAPTVAITPTTTGGEPTLAITPTTTGGELVDQLSAKETACIRDGLGDAGFEGFRGATLIKSAGEPAGAMAVFSCLTAQNARAYGLAVLDAQAGRRSEATRSCLEDLAQKHPELLPLHLRLEMGQFGAADAQRFHDMTLAMYACLNDAEKVEYVIRLWVRVAEYAPLSGPSFMATLTGDERSCLRGALTQSAFDALADTASLSAGGGVGAAAAHCLDAETEARIFLQTTRERVGGFRDASRACLERYADEHPDYVRLIAAAETGAVPVAALGEGGAEGAIIELANDGWRLFDCLHEEELLRYQLLTSAALAP